MLLNGWGTSAVPDSTRQGVDWRRSQEDEEPQWSFSMKIIAQSHGILGESDEMFWMSVDLQVDMVEEILGRSCYVV